MLVEYQKSTINMDLVFNFYIYSLDCLAFEGSNDMSRSFNNIDAKEAYDHIIKAIINNSPFLNVDEYERNEDEKTH